jgi:hypothetical protein
MRDGLRLRQTAVLANWDDTNLTSSAMVEGAPVLSVGALAMRLRR